MRFKIGDRVRMSVHAIYSPEARKSFGEEAVIVDYSNHPLADWIIETLKTKKRIYAKERALEPIIGSWDEITNSLGFDLRKERELATN